MKATITLLISVVAILTLYTESASISPEVLLTDSILETENIRNLAKLQYGQWKILTDLPQDKIFSDVSPNCQGHVMEWLTQLEPLFNQNVTGTAALWALHMLDAFAKPPEGILSGHLNAMGDFDECVGIRVKDQIFSANVTQHFPDLPTDFHGRYCTMQLLPNMTSFQNLHPEGLRAAVAPSELIDLMGIMEGARLLPSIGTCLPSSCSNTDAGNLTRNALAHMGLSHFFNPSPFYCAVGEKPPFDAGDISLLAFLGTLFALSVFAGCVELWIYRKERSTPGLALQYLLAFSFNKNIEKWANTRTPADDVGCIHGLRFLSTAWVILIHTWFMVTYIPNWNMVDVKNMYKDWTILTIRNATVSVDTFFVIAGCLVTYNLMKVLDKSNGRLNVPMFYIHRYLRLTPVYAAIVWMMATIFPYLGSGPYWRLMENWSILCEENWWTNLLYVNNFVRTDRLCQGEAWYLACDMQFYILSPIFVYSLWRWKRAGWGILGISTVVSLIIPSLQIYLEEDYVTPTLVYSRNQYTFYRDVYMKPYSRIQTYLVGIVLGYFLYKYKGKRVTIPKVVQLICWVVATVACLSAIYGIFGWLDPLEEIPRIPASLYGGLHRFGWGISVSWIIFACVKGYGGLINTFLSWKVFVPLGKLCFAAYLVSLHLQMTLHLGMKQPITYDKYTMTNLFFAHVFLSFLVGFFCNLFIETPFLTVEKLFFDGPAKPPLPPTVPLKKIED